MTPANQHTGIERLSDELLPCPFCGSTNVMVIDRTCDRNTPYNPADFAYPRVICKCGVEVPGKNWERKQTAIEAWNRRASAEPESGQRADAVHAMYQYADITARHWRSKGAGGPGFEDELEKAEQIALDAVAHPHSALAGGSNGRE